MRFQVIASLSGDSDCAVFEGRTVLRKMDASPSPPYDCAGDRVAIRLVTAALRPATNVGHLMFWLSARRTRCVKPVAKLAEQSDEALAAEAAREGSDGPAFVELLARHRDRVWRICYRLLGNAEDAQDAAQEVFVRLFMQRAGFVGRSKYSTWVHGIAVRTCLMLRRSQGRRRRHEAEAARQSPTQCDAAEPGLSLDVAQMLDHLDEEDRAMVILKYCENYSYDELAEIFGISAAACKMRVSRAKEKIQREFAPET